MNATRAKRGPYKQYLTDSSRPIPRQTLANWRTKLSGSLAREHAEVEAAEDIADSSSLPVSAEAVLQNSRDCEEQWSTTDEDCSAATCSRSPSPAPVSPTPADTEPPLYPGARISGSMGLHLLHSLTLKHGITHVALADLLKVVALHIPATHAIPTAYRSVHCFLRASNMRAHSEKVHTLCSDCGELIQDENGGVHSQQIKFYEMPIDKQLKDLFQGKAYKGAWIIQL